MPQLIALCDCNAFYVSCERVFRPDLWDEPAAALSNNGGIPVARSQEYVELPRKWLNELLVRTTHA
jgi:DNA polymerase V